MIALTALLYAAPMAPQCSAVALNPAVGHSFPTQPCPAGAPRPPKPGYPTNNDVVLPNCATVQVPSENAGWQGCALPVANPFEGYPGCYAACVTRGHAGDGSAGARDFVVGLVRVAGAHWDYRCWLRSNDYEGLPALCAKHFASACGEDGCAARVDTYYWMVEQS